MKYLMDKKLFVLSVLIILIVLIMPGCTNKKQIIEKDNSIEKTEENKINNMIKDMTLEEKIGQLLMPDFRKWKGKRVTAINHEIASIIKDYHIGGVILFEENFEGRNQTKQLIQSFQSMAKIPLMFAVDQEGGLITRIPFFPKMPGNMALGATGNSEIARKVGLAIGSELNRLGIHINFGPVLDINNNPDNPVIGVRSFGDNIENVTKMGLAYMTGLNEAGVAAVGKHFPGHGDVNLDSHYILPSSTKTLIQLSELELIPFQATIDNGIQGIMTAHITFSQIDLETAKSIKDGLPIEIPATLSYEIMNDLLREKMGFKGLLFTDAMNMSAVSNHFKSVDSAIRAINAGADVLLMPINLKLVYEGLIEAVKSGKISENRINESVSRILKLKMDYVFDSNNDNKIIVDAVEAMKIEQEAINLSITLVKNEGIIPLEIGNNEKIAIIGFDDSDVKHMKNAVRRNYWNVKTIVLNKDTNYMGKLGRSLKNKLDDVEWIIVVTNTANVKDDMWKVYVTQSIIEHGIPTIVVAARNPYDAIYLEGKYVFIAQYDNGILSFNATSDVIFGKLEPTGKLPVELVKN